MFIQRASDWIFSKNSYFMSFHSKIYVPSFKFQSNWVQPIKYHRSGIGRQNGHSSLHCDWMNDILVRSYGMERRHRLRLHSNDSRSRHSWMRKSFAVIERCTIHTYLLLWLLRVGERESKQTNDRSVTIESERQCIWEINTISMAKGLWIGCLSLLCTHSR